MEERWERSRYVKRRGVAISVEKSMVSHRGQKIGHKGKRDI